MSYVNAAVLAVPNKNKEAYIAQAKVMAEMFKKHGALSVAECWGDMVPPGERTSFPLAVQCQENETVVVSWIVWPSKEVANEGMQAAMAEATEKASFNPEIFDGGRMIFGGFEFVLDA